MRYFLSGVIYTRKVERGVVCSIRKDRGPVYQNCKWVGVLITRKVEREGYLRYQKGWEGRMSEVPGRLRGRGSTVPERLRGEGVCGTVKVRGDGGSGYQKC
jgi:hypothetical protein